ncbi:hypothetical protein ACWOF5_13725 [Carnobacterium divergens]
MIEIYFGIGFLFLLVLIIGLLIYYRNKELKDLELIMEIYLTKKDKLWNNLWYRRWRELQVFAQLLLFAGVGVIAGVAISNMYADYFVVGDKNFSFSSVGILISTLSLFFTVYISMTNKKASKLDSNVKFIQGLINNNYTILNKINEKSTKNILNSIKVEFKDGVNFQQRVSKAVNENYKLDSDVKDRLRYKRDSIEQDSYENKELVVELNSIIKGGQKECLKWLMTYYYENKKDEFRKFSKMQKENRFKQIIKESKKDKELCKLSNEIFSVIENILESTPKNICYNDTYEVINNIYLKEYGDIGSFLRHSYRIVKYINKNIKDKVLRQELLGMLRAYYSEDILLVIFYNAIFTETGLGFGRELLYSDFFGDNEDVKNFDYPPHMRKDSLAFLTVDERSFETEIIKMIFIEEPSEKKIKRNMSKFDIEINIKNNVRNKFDSFYQSK